MLEPKSGVLLLLLLLLAVVVVVAVVGTCQQSLAWHRTLGVFTSGAAAHSHPKSWKRTSAKISQSWSGEGPY